VRYARESAALARNVADEAIPQLRVRLRAELERVCGPDDAGQRRQEFVRGVRDELLLRQLVAQA
jgi:hypothetical protein